MPPYKMPLEKIRDNIMVDPNSGCWLFTGGLDKCGYSKLSGGKDIPGESLGHRMSYLIFKGPIPDGTEIDHKCRVRSCINPAHLQAVSHAKNVSLADYKTNHRNGVKTHCKRGHEFTPENTMVNRHGSYSTRKCRACTSERQRRSYERKKMRPH